MRIVYCRCVLSLSFLTVRTKKKIPTMSSELVSIGLEDESSSSKKEPTAYEKKKLKRSNADAKKKKKMREEEFDEGSIKDASYCDILLLLLCCCKCCYCCGLIRERKKVTCRAVCECSMLTFIFLLMLIFIPARLSIYRETTTLDYYLNSTLCSRLDNKYRFCITPEYR